ncbi:hypothetical protein [Ralstonia pseudosolanacearum]|uniref:hypothetical protein n=1 Tax=Ralstonia pseudosolanacearum TaxID=1310165 RepID=UPI00267633B8|nr:hypothetical protein [Ralstonia pseudosolanacearum]MDO3509413.1 hypothetical protein [Ralstonia pseudosolanacearum]MDO3514427.1 hypothetical protein [Ralstonia pseudosolanacearum]MDO3539177.1 hypothetical protein [Ralstonia pseudosolanacearum]MDO3608156.1 hypothetical protein [Ralstonia pseudosolanacearum]MDO3612587.1 hypothetical protein [Ralstonia pseudosolanacearum]
MIAHPAGMGICVRLARADACPRANGRRADDIGLHGCAIPGAIEKTRATSTICKAIHYIAHNARPCGQHADHRPALRTTATSGNAVETESRINALRADRLPTVIATGNSKTRSPAATTS